jgi:hypothetical protein
LEWIGEWGIGLKLLKTKVKIPIDFCVKGEGELTGKGVGDPGGEKSNSLSILK